MDLAALVARRSSVRDYLNTPVTDAVIEKVLDAARLAPSACNNQPARFVVVRDEEARRKLQPVYDREWFLKAPVIIAACCDRTLSWRRSDGKDYGDVDVAIALDHLTLAATELGLGTCWIASFNPAQARAALMLPSSVDPVAFTPLGYPGSGHAARKSRKSLAEMVSWEFFGGLNR
jgi:nitroreductase